MITDITRTKITSKPKMAVLVLPGWIVSCVSPKWTIIVVKFSGTLENIQIMPVLEVAN